MRTMFRWTVPLLLLGWVALLPAAAPVAGRDYTEISPARPSSDPSRVVVTEFFSYQCPHCAAFAPNYAAWVKSLPADVQVERVPVSIGHPTWQPAARTYHALVAMNALAKVDDALFAAIHREGVRLDTEQQITRWLGTRGIDVKAFTAMYRSFSVDSQFKAGDARARDLRVPGIPALVIDGRYLMAISDRSTGRDAHFRAQLAVANELIARARQQRAAGATQFSE
jgi:thiol:disulfide interchange protein DsbA